MDSFVIAAKRSKRKISVRICWDSSKKSLKEAKKKFVLSLRRVQITTEQITGQKGQRQTKRAQNEQDAIGSISEILKGMLKMGDSKHMGGATDASKTFTTMQQVSG